MRTALLSAPLACLALSGPLAAQCWDQHLVHGTTETGLPSGLAFGPGRIAFGQPRFNPTGSPAIRDLVHVFEGAPGSFAHLSTLSSSLAVPSQASFGRELDLDGDRLAVGDRAAFTGINDVSGAIHLYLRKPAGIVLEAVVSPPVGGFVSIGEFGASFDLEGDTLVAGAPTSTSAAGGLEDGAVFVYERIASTWTLTQVIAHPAPQIFASFGHAVALDGDRLVVGSPGDPVPGGTPFNGGNAGALFVLERSPGGAFQLTATLRAATPTAGARLGASVDVDADRIAAGAPGEVVNGAPGAGRARVLELGPQGWLEVATLDEPPLRPIHGFGDDVEWGAGSLFVTASGTASARRFDSVAGAWTSAHAYTTEAGVGWPTSMPVRVRANASSVVLTDPSGATVLPFAPAAQASIGCSAAPLPGGLGIPGIAVPLGVSSELRLSNSNLELAVYGGSSVGAGILFYGFSPANVPLGTGTRCVGGALARAAVGAPGLGGQPIPLALDLQAPPVSSGALAILPGVDVHLQYWFRTASSSHLTNSLVLAFCP